MKKFSVPALPVWLALVFLAPGCGSNDSGAKKDTTAPDKPAPAGLLTTLQSKADTAAVKSMEEIIKNAKDDPVAIQYLGHYAYLNRQLETAAWLYALDGEKKPGDIINQSNLALCLHEMSVKDPANKDLLRSAIEILEKAATAAPGNAAVHNNLGYAYYQQYLNSNDSTLLDKAAAAFEKAISIDPSNSVYHSHLGAVKKAQKKTEDAIKHFNHAFSISPFDGVFLASTAGFSDYAAAKNSRSHCDSINYNCIKNCPPSIIGRIKVINCEIAQQDARMACREGKPYATSYNCDDEIPSTGFMIPGLQSGFGIITPWGKLSVLVQGGGKIDVKIEVNTPVPGVRFTASGTYDPSSGMSVTQFGGQASVNLYNQGSVAPMLNTFNMGPAGVKINAGTGPSGSSVQLEAYDTPVVLIH
jgi:tetratricopeptide (TPR) repeat protein